LNDALKEAMKAKDAPRTSTLRLILAAIKDRDIANRTADARDGISDDDILKLLQSMIKQRRDSLSQFEQAGREDLAQRERGEIETLSAYLPRQADPAEIESAIAAAVAETGAAGPQDMGKVMALLKPRLAGRADLSAVSAAVRARLAGH
jgi:uncharacterized protein YqeY